MSETRTEFAFPTLEGFAVGAGGNAERVAAIITAAEQRAARIEQDALERGFAAGFASGVTDATQRIEDAVVALQLACAGLADHIDARVEEVERRAAEFGLALAEKILSTSLDLRPELVASLATGALRGLTERDHVVVEVSPDDLEIVRAAREDLVDRLGGFARVEVVPERRIGRGGAVIQTSEGEIDARPSVQLERAEAILRDVLAGRE